MFRRILVGYDGSTEAQRALQVAAPLAADLQGEAHVLLVVRPGAHAETPEERERAAGGRARQPLEGPQLDADPEPHPWERLDGGRLRRRPAQAIASYAEEHGFDLVVVGGHGREQMTHRGIGRSLEALLRHHPCPVLVV